MNKSFRSFTRALIMLLSFAVTTQLFAQATYHGCKMGGSNASLAIFDSLKNRFTIPKAYGSIDFTKMASMKYDDKTSQDKAVKIKAYIIEIKYGGPETCNCHTKIKDDFDVHIVLSKDENDLDAKDGIVAELTPRIRALLKNGWDKATVERTFLHQWVTVSGYLFDDKEHKAMSAADGAHPNNTHRATCWEIHPVTNIELTTK